MDILFISSKGSQYRYFKALSRATRFTARVVALFPELGFKLINSELTKSKIKKGIEFHLERKRRKYTEGKLNIIVFKLYRLLSMVYFSLIYLKFRHFLMKYQPKVICIWNGHRLPEMAIKSAAEGLNIEIAYFENGLLPDTTVMDFSGVNAFSSLPREKDFYLKYAKARDLNNNYRKPLVERNPHKKRKKLTFEGFDFNSKYIFVPFQVDYDSQVIINSPKINSMTELFDFILYLADRVDDPDLVFVIKEHPSDVRSYTSFHHIHERIKFVNESTEKLIEYSEAIITLNSSVGIEAAMMGARVFVLGHACYGVDGVVKNINNSDELFYFINSPSAFSQDETLVTAFFNYLNAEYLLPVAWQKNMTMVDKEHIDGFDEKIGSKLFGNSLSGK